MQPKVILCPGQGAQALRMGKAWCGVSSEASAVFAEADTLLGDRLGPKLTDLCWNGPEDRLNRTDVCQPAIYTASVACWRGLLARWGAGDVVEANVIAAAGLSLGEYTALHLAGVFSFADGLELVTLRGRAMQDAADATPSGMVALVGANEQQAQEVCDGARGKDMLVCANFNAPGQVVISGSASACDRAVGVAEKMGLRAQRLAVAGAFHSPLMQPAADRLHEALAKTPVSAPRFPVVSNVTAQPHSADLALSIEDAIRVRLVEQLTSPVRWAEGCAWLIGNAGALVRGKAGEGANEAKAVEYVELAPGRTLSGLMRRIDRHVKVCNYAEPEEA